MSGYVGVYVVNARTIMVRKENGSTTEISRRVYEDADYRPSVRNLPSYNEYHAKLEQSDDDEDAE